MARHHKAIYIILFANSDDIPHEQNHYPMLHHNLTRTLQTSCNHSAPWVPLPNLFGYIAADEETPTSCPTTFSSLCCLNVFRLLSSMMSIKMTFGASARICCFHKLLWSSPISFYIIFIFLYLRLFIHFHQA